MTKLTILTDSEYTELKARNDHHNAWVDTLRKRSKCRKCKGTGKKNWGANAGMVCVKCEGKGYTLGWARYKPEDKPAHVPDVSNEERSRIEVYEFMRDKPGRYFAYVSKDLSQIQTWTGDYLGKIVWHGARYKVQGFGPRPGERINLRIEAVNGLVYSAVFYVSSGDYCRMKVMSSSKNSTEVKANG